MPRLASSRTWARGMMQGVRVWMGAEQLGRKARQEGQPRESNPFTQHAGLSRRNAGDLHRMGETAWFEGWDNGDKPEQEAPF